ncbi:MAG: acyltransferase [Phycisphaerales bacterium]|nr:acyltransferase [Phycisphaerales bacterium]MCB9835954.1 acyltransferase [Phycisphaera sp.]
MEETNPAQRTSRYAGIDAARVVAAAGVVFTHWLTGSEAIWLKQASRFAVPFFIAAAVFFTVNQCFSGRAIPRMIGDRAWRILLPYIMWSAVYFLLKYVISGWIIGGIHPHFSLSDAVDGFGGHLWFLPFIFLVGVCAVVSAKIATRSAALSAVLALGACFATGIVLRAFPASTGNLDRWPYELPIALIMFAITVSTQRGWITVARHGLLSFGFLATAVALVLWSLKYESFPDRRACQLAGIALLLAGISMPSERIPAWLSRLGRLGFGVYITHGLLIMVLHKLFGKVGHGSQTTVLVAYPFVLAGAFAFTAICYRLPVVRLMMPTRQAGPRRQKDQLALASSR